jgi:N-acetyl-anhydromuramyl-L-alanine amidase AmpD
MLSVKVYTTAEWKARPAKASAPRTVPRYIVIHHTATTATARNVEQGKQLARSIQKYHMDVNGWIDSGHNFLISQVGDIFEGRHGTVQALLSGKCVRSAHSGNVIANASPGIENEGNFSTTAMPAAQWDALVALCSDLCKGLKIGPDRIKGHRDFRRTACPGDWLYKNLPRLRGEVAARLNRASA